MDSTSDTRQDQIEQFLSDAGWSTAHRTALHQDASTRSYVRLSRANGETAILMNAPGVEDAPCPPEADEAERKAMGWNALTRLAASRVDAFIALAGDLKARGLSAPDILASETEQGLALLEDFGEGREFARLIERGEADEVKLYTSAIDVLADLHKQPFPEAAKGHGQTWPILDFDHVALRTNADLFAEWMPQFDDRIRWGDTAADRWAEERDKLIALAIDRPRAFTLRDFHAENLIWLPERTGKARIGLLDFQDAVNGWAAWDLAMLTQDARRDVSKPARESALDAYSAATGTPRSEIDEELAIIGTLNAMRITGLFARLITRDQKPRYGAFLNRQQIILARNLRHPAVAEMASFVADVAPHILEMDDG